MNFEEIQMVPKAAFNSAERVVREGMSDEFSVFMSICLMFASVGLESNFVDSGGDPGVDFEELVI